MGTLFIVATPIGNLEDTTIRALKTLFTADIIVCEDTRRTGQLLSLLKSKYNAAIRIVGLKKPKLISYYEEIEFKKIPQIIDLLKKGKNIALVSDGGTPLISDPGYKLVRQCIWENIPVQSIPGPSSIISALVVSGLSLDKFLFLGYLPHSATKRIKMFTDIFQCFERSKNLKPTLVFFESKHRLIKSLTDIKGVFGDTKVVVARELTKKHEEIFRGSVKQAIEKYQNPKGEFVVLVKIPPE